MATAAKELAFIAVMVMVMLVATAPFRALAADGDGNDVFSPCEDSKVKRSDGFSFGIAFASTRQLFSLENVELSPCDSRLGFANNPSVKVAVFRPYVDEISLLTINTSDFQAVFSGMHMVAFAGRKYAARSLPTFVGNNSYIVTGFTLVLEFQKGTLQNLFWKRDGCAPCSGKTDFVCLANEECAIHTSSCKSRGGKVDCKLGIQVAFSGTDKGDRVLNSWYEVAKLRQYSLSALFSNLKDSFASQFSGFF